MTAEERERLALQIAGSIYATEIQAALSFANTPEHAEEIRDAQVYQALEAAHFFLERCEAMRSEWPWLCLYCGGQARHDPGARCCPDCTCWRK